MNTVNKKCSLPISPRVHSKNFSKFYKIQFSLLNAYNRKLLIRSTLFIQKRHRWYIISKITLSKEFEICKKKLIKVSNILKLNFSPHEVHPGISGQPEVGFFNFSYFSSQMNQEVWKLTEIICERLRNNAIRTLIVPDERQLSVCLA